MTLTFSSLAQMSQEEQRQYTQSITQTIQTTITQFRSSHPFVEVLPCQKQ